MSTKQDKLLDLQMRARTTEERDALAYELARKGHGPAANKDPLFAVWREDTGMFYYFTTAGGIEWRRCPWLFEDKEHANIMMNTIVNGWDEARKWVDPADLSVINMPVPRPTIKVVEIHPKVARTVYTIEGID